MGNTHVISGLKRKRMELSGELMRIYRDERRLRAEIKTVDETLKLFGCTDTDHKQRLVGSFKRLFARNELPRLVSKIQKEFPDMTDHRDIARAVMTHKEWDPNDALLYNRVVLKVRDIFARWERELKQS